MRAAQNKKFLTSTKREPSFFTKGFSYWKEATTAFNKHQEVIATGKSLLSTAPSKKVGDALSTKVKQQKVENRKKLKC